MSKTKETIIRLYKEGLLDKFFNAIEKSIKKMSDSEFEKAKLQYDKDYQKIMKRLRNESSFWRKK